MATQELTAAVDYLMRERCPHCKRRGNPGICGCKLARAYEGWHCHGYGSRHWDERGWVR